MALTNIYNHMKGGAMGLEYIPTSNYNPNYIKFYECNKYGNVLNKKSNKKQNMGNGYALHEEIGLSGSNTLVIYLDIGKNFFNYITNFNNKNIIDLFIKAIFGNNLSPTLTIKPISGEYRYEYITNYPNFNDTNPPNANILQAIQDFHKKIGKPIIDILK